jgi:hypothetical protein
MAPSPALLYIFRVLVKDEGWRDLVSVLPPETVFPTGLPENAIVGTLLNPDGHLRDPEEKPVDLSPASFAENPVFRTLYYDVVARLALEDPGIHYEARRKAERYVYVMDSRTPTPGGEVPAEDIIGCFEVRDGSIVRDPFIPSSKYRLFGENGFFTLDVTFHQELLAEIARRPTDLYAEPAWILGAWAVSFEAR